MIKYAKIILTDMQINHDVKTELTKFDIQLVKYPKEVGTSDLSDGKMPIDLIPEDFYLELLKWILSRDLSKMSKFHKLKLVILNRL